jgi:hypothetical protein
MEASAGFDDDVPGRPGDPASFDYSIGNEPFLRLSPAVDAAGSWGPWRLSGGYKYEVNGYGSEAAGVYQDHLGWMGVIHRAGPLDVGLEGWAESFRRTEYGDASLDRFEGGPRIDYRLAPGWNAGASLLAGRITFPERTLTDVRPLTLQSDTPVTLEAHLGRRFGAHRATASLSRLTNGSNESLSRYSGWRGELRGDFTVRRIGAAAVQLSFERRGYDENPAATPLDRSDRIDSSTGIDLDLKRGLTSRLAGFLQASLLDYRSSTDGYSFTESAGRIGLTVRLGSVGAGRAGRSTGFGGMAPPATAPRREGGDVIFRHVAPDARSVAIAGNFNRWSREAHPLADPDGDGTWEVSIPLPSGRYHYIFLVDGTSWQSPEGAPLEEDDGFGLRNGVLEIP